MSDLISTPSQTRSPVSNEAFESLIELLASDGIDENRAKLANGSDPRSQANPSLRDPSGRLDFDKIRLMFAASNRGSPSTGIFGEERASGMARDDSDSDDEHPSESYRSTESSVAPTRANSMSPKLVERPPAGHRRSSTFGNQPWTTIHENAAPAIENALPTLSHKPLSLDELNTALAGAHEEVKVLRQQYDDLQALVSRRLGTETRDQAKLFPSTIDSEKVIPEKDNGGSQTQAPAPVPSGVPIEIADLSETEAKRALAALARSLNLSLNVLVGLSNSPVPTSPQTLPSCDLTQERDIASITRGMRFLSTVDELVWRRTSAPSGSHTLSPVSSEENIAALVARLELWERTIRRSSRT